MQSEAGWRNRHERTNPARKTDRQGLCLRPGGPLVPRVRRLRHRPRHAKDPGRSSIGAGEDRFRIRYRVRRALPLLHGDLWISHHPRTRGLPRDRGETRQPGPGRVGHLRRRRCALHRRQSPDACAAPQREPAIHPVQQRDLRAHQGSVLADLPARHAFALDPAGFGRCAGQPGLLRAWLRREVRRPVDRFLTEAPARGLRPRPHPPGRVVRRGVPELHRLQ